MIDCYRYHFKFLSAIQIKYFRKKVIFYEIQSKMKVIPQSRKTWMLILRLPLIVLLANVCWHVSSSMKMKKMLILWRHWSMSRFKLMQFSSRQFFGLTVSPVQQRLNLCGCNKKVIKWLRCRAWGPIWLPQCQYDQEAHLGHIIICIVCVVWLWYFLIIITYFSEEYS